MKPLTIKELAATLQKAVKEGYGDYFISVSNDEEQNGFHELWENQLYVGTEIEYLDNGEMKKGKTLEIG